MAKRPNDGGPAFPSYDNRGDGFTVQGMTLRDWFAGQALVGLTREAFRYVVERPDGDSGEHDVLTDRAYEVLTEVGGVAYAMADAMLAERERDR